MEESSPPPVSTNRARDEDQRPLQNEGYLKQTHVHRYDASGKVTPFIQMPYVFSSQVARSPKEDAYIVSMSDLSFI